jgi:hypothetical protein
MNFSKFKTMSPVRLFADLMTSKYFLWFIAILSAVNIVGYMTMGYVDAVVLFALVAFITFTFSKNMTVVLLASVVIVNLFMQTGGATEGFQEGAGNEGGSRGGKNTSIDAPAAPGNLSESIVNIDDASPDDDGVEPDEPETTTTTTETTTVEEDDEDELKENLTSKTKKEGYNNKKEIKPAIVKQHNHIDYATTLEDAYKNLESMIGEGGLQNLTADTKKLMDQQSKLFNSMDQIAPLLSKAQEMMKNMDMSQFSGGGKASKLSDSAGRIGKSSA